jgi:MHS family proline/betaine transporter-like MFS transporter
MVYLYETAQPKKLFFYSSLGSCAASAGILLASLSASLCYALFDTEQLYSFAWRLPFFSSVILCVITILLRRNLPESPLFNSLNRVQNPLRQSLSNQKHEYVLAFCITFLPATGFYFIFVFWPALYAEISGGGAAKSLETNTWSLLLRLFLIPIVGAMADKFGGIRIASISSILFILLSVPIFVLSMSSSQHFALPLLFFMGLLTTLNAGTTPGILATLFSSRTRATTMSLTLNVCFGILGGLTPVICFYAWEKTQSFLYPPLLLLISGIITLAALSNLRSKIKDERTIKAD